jgi:hypothetical protein
MGLAAGAYASGLRQHDGDSPVAPCKEQPSDARACALAYQFGPNRRILARRSACPHSNLLAWSDHAIPCLHPIEGHGDHPWAREMRDVPLNGGVSQHRAGHCSDPAVISSGLATSSAVVLASRTMERSERKRRSAVTLPFPVDLHEDHAGKPEQGGALGESPTTVRRSFPPTTARPSAKHPPT